METHAAQDVKMVLMHAGQYPLADGGECAFVVGQKDGLNEYGYMNPTDTTTDGWRGCARRGWCNSDYKEAFPATLKSIFRPAAVTTGIDMAGGSAVTDDYFALPAEKEIFGTNIYGNSTAEVSLFQLKYYEIAANRIKKGNGSPLAYWERSNWTSGAQYFCMVNANGEAFRYGASQQGMLAPQGCIGKKVAA